MQTPAVPRCANCAAPNFDATFQLSQSGHYGDGSAPDPRVENKTLLLRRQSAHRPKDLGAVRLLRDVASFRLHLAAGTWPGSSRPPPVTLAAALAASIASTAHVTGSGITA